MNILVAFLSCLVMMIIGYVVIKVFKLLENVEDMEKLPYSFGLGAGLVAFQLYIYSRLTIEWGVLSVIVPWVFFIIVARFFNKLQFKLTTKKIKVRFFAKVVILLIFLLVLYVFAESIVRPLTSWDGWSSWLFRAKMFSMENGVEAKLFFYVPTEYPVLVSLMSSFIYLLMGAIDDRAVLLLYPFFYLFLGSMFFISLKKHLGMQMSILFAFLLFSTQNLIRHSGRFEAGQADVILAFYVFATIMLFLLYEKSRDFRNLLLLQSFLAITALIKDEGAFFALFIEVILAYFVIKMKAYRHLVAFILFFFPFVEWQFYKTFLDLPKVPSYIQYSYHMERIPIILSEFIKEFANLSNWNFLWPAFFISFFCYVLCYKKNMQLLFLHFTVIFQLGIYAGVFLFTSPDPIYHIPNVINRTFLHLAPLALFAVGMTYAVYKKYKYDKI